MFYAKISVRFVIVLGALLCVASLSTKRAEASVRPAASRPQYEFSVTADGSSIYAGDMGRDKVFQMYRYLLGRLIYRFKDPKAYEGFAGICASPAANVGVW